MEDIHSDRAQDIYAKKKKNQYLPYTKIKGKYYEKGVNHQTIQTVIHMCQKISIKVSVVFE